MELARTLAATGGNSTAATANTATKGFGSDFETFLKMLTVQMSNQDPLNPLESTDFAVQLATFSGVEQQVRGNDLLESLSARMNILGMSQMAGWVGMEARAAAPVLFDGTPVELSANPPAAADKAILVVRNGAGVVVDRAEIPVPREPILWSGTDGNGDPAPTDNYTFSLETYAGDSYLSEIPFQTYGQIAEARNENGSMVLVMYGGTKIPMLDVTGLRPPRTT